MTNSDGRLSLLRRYSIALFFVLAMALGGGTVYLVAQVGLPTLMVLAAAISASIAGIIMTAVTDGTAGLKLMLRRLLIWRVETRYWLFAFFFILFAVLLGSIANPLFNSEPVSLSNVRLGFEILPMFIGFFIVSGLGQELGWTGFLIPRLQAHFSALTACIVRAILTVIWHLPLLYYSRLQLPIVSDFAYSGWIAQKGYLVAVLAMTLMFMLPWSIFLNWIFNNTKGSLLLVAILHTSEIWVAYWMLSAGLDYNNLDNYWGYGSIMVLVAVIIVIMTGPQNLSRQHKRIVYLASPG